MDLSIVIVSWNVREKLKTNLEVISTSEGGLESEVFVVDNNSEDGSAEMVREKFPWVKLIANAENFGFSKANNQAIKQARGEFILLLNPDMKVMSDTLAKMVAWMRTNNKADAAGCHLVDGEGKTVQQVRRFPKFLDQLAIALKFPHIWSAVLNRYLRVDFNYSQASVVDSLRGSFFMIRRSTIEKIGLLDERYFIWFEEVDYCLRIKKAGGQVWYAPSAMCLDYVGQSFKQVARGKKQKYFRDSMLAYFKKWQPTWQYWFLKLAWELGDFISWVGEAARVPSRVKT